MTEPDTIGGDPPDETASELMDSSETIDIKPSSAHENAEALGVPPLSTEANYASHESKLKTFLSK